MVRESGNAPEPRLERSCLLSCGRDTGTNAVLERLVGQRSKHRVRNVSSRGVEWKRLAGEADLREEPRDLGVVRESDDPASGRCTQHRAVEADRQDKVESDRELPERRCVVQCGVADPGRAAARPCREKLAGPHVVIAATPRAGSKERQQLDSGSSLVHDSVEPRGELSLQSLGRVRRDGRAAPDDRSRRDAYACRPARVACRGVARAPPKGLQGLEGKVTHDFDWPARKLGELLRALAIACRDKVEPLDFLGDRVEDSPCHEFADAHADQDGRSAEPEWNANTAQPVERGSRPVCLFADEVAPAERDQVAPQGCAEEFPAPEAGCIRARTPNGAHAVSGRGASWIRRDHRRVDVAKRPGQPPEESLEHRLIAEVSLAEPANGEDAGGSRHDVEPTANELPCADVAYTPPMPRTEPTPFTVRAAIFRREFRGSLRARRPRAAARAICSLVAPGRWRPNSVARAAELDRAVARGDARSAAVVLAELDPKAGAHHPGKPAALRRAAALDTYSSSLPPAEGAVERTVASYLRGELAAPPVAATDVGSVVARSADAAARLRNAGHDRPLVLATYPGFIANPYAALMERSFSEHGLAAIHVGEPDAVDAIVDAASAGGYRVAVHLNAADRFVRTMPPSADAVAIAATTLSRVDGWRARGAAIITTIHNGPQHDGNRGEAERTVAQGIVDRADLVHLLTVSTPALLEGWLDLSRAPCVHIPHPNYDGAYGPRPSSVEARRQLGITADNGILPIVVGLLGTLAARKGGVLLVEALADVPDPLPNGRRLHVLLGGVVFGGSGEELIRRAMADPRVTPRLGFIREEDLPLLLAALDIAVVPYGRYLNSGWLHLALTAGIPVVASTGGTADEIVRPLALRTFPAGDRAGLAATLTHADELATPEARGAARASVDELDAGMLSHRLATAILTAIAAEGARVKRP